MVLKSSDDIVSPISGIRFTSDGLYVVSLNAAKTFEIWRAHTLESIRLTTVFFFFVNNSIVTQQRHYQSCFFS